VSQKFKSFKFIEVVQQHILGVLNFTATRSTPATRRRTACRRRTVCCLFVT